MMPKSFRTPSLATESLGLVAWIQILAFDQVVGLLDAFKFETGG
ncbi:MAG: hypothetical protein ACR2HZ_08965 [Gemmatimonadaceae bacterium]